MPNEPHAPAGTSESPPARQPVEIHDDVLVIGDGPVGVSAALYLARNGVGAHVLGTDQTPMHKAELHNHPGTPDVTGTQLMQIAKQQAIHHGAHIHHQKVIGVQQTGDRYSVRTEKGHVFTGRYLVLATGRGKHLAETLGLEMSELGVKIDIHGRTSAPNVYAGGNLARGVTQAIISMGDGAAIAIDILSREKGQPFHDYDVLQASPRRQPA